MFGCLEKTVKEDRDGGSNDECGESESDSTISHAWLGPRKILQLLDPSSDANYKEFLKEWRRDYPVIISHITGKLDSKLWTPTFFSQSYGECKVDFVDILTEEVIPGQKMKYFWAGFEDLGSRSKDKRSSPMFIKLKEWPRRTMFESVLPAQMSDLLTALPLPSFTHPNGLLNFINFLPEGLLTDELGTELLCAYGSSKYPGVGTQKIKVNKFDSLSILVYVGRMANEDNIEETEKVLQSARDAGCDKTSLERVTKNGDIPGAVWHVYDRKDSNKINDFLKKINFSRGIISQPNQNLMNGENWYLDGILRGRLQREYGIEAHAILHCLGDAIIVPAGAPYQVNFLRSCIEVKHSFISFENMKKLK